MKVFLGMSGGVDSAVSAYLLQQQGHEVIGVYMKNWSKNLPGMKCPWAEDLADAKRVAVKLGIDFRVFDFEKEYKQKVVDYMLEEYQKGNTPNKRLSLNYLLIPHSSKAQKQLRLVIMRARTAKPYFAQRTTIKIRPTSSIAFRKILFQK